MERGLIYMIVCLVGLLFFTAKDNYSQDYCTGNRFLEEVFSTGQVDVQNNIIYGSAVNNLGVSQNLLLDIYYPDTLVDEFDKKPVIVFVHGGGLVGGSKESDGATDMGMKFAQRGYVFVSIDYRIGWDSGGEDSCNGDIQDYYRAQYRGVQDTKAAIRFLKEKAHIYQIDTNYIFGSGTSAGSNLLLYAAYADENVFQSALIDEYGSIDSSGNEFYDHSVDFAGLILESAGLEDTSIFYNKTIPTIYFHGTCDGIIDFFAGPMFLCYEPILYPTFYGGWEQVRLLERLGRPYHFYIGEGGAHDVAIPDTIVEYAGEFIKEILCNNLVTRNIYRIVGRGRCAVENNGKLFIEPIYPNPVDDLVNITVTSVRDRDIDLVIYNSMGQAVETDVLDFYPPIQSYVIDISLLPKGVYFMVVSQRQEIYLIQFVK